MAYEKYLPRLKACGVFKHEAADNQWSWFFAQHIPDFHYEGYELCSDDYPQILACGSKAFIFAEATKGSPWVSGCTPAFLANCTVYPCDMSVFGKFHRQKEMRDERKAQALYDVFCGNIQNEDRALYAELIKQGYVVVIDGHPYCNVAVLTQKSRDVFTEINAQLLDTLKNFCEPIRGNISGIVKTTLPEQLKEYVKGYAETWISFYARTCLLESLHNSGMITIPEENDLTPVACYIHEVRQGTVPCPTPVPPPHETR
ncbi:MAG TPA: hypothetical protein GX739_06935 [Firmicutes bacterium]|nr:hypothetical protein [Bacillota bacterium]